MFTAVVRRPAPNSVRQESLTYFQQPLPNTLDCFRPNRSAIIVGQRHIEIIFFHRWPLPRCWPLATIPRSGSRLPAGRVRHRRRQRRRGPAGPPPRMPHQQRPGLGAVARAHSNDGFHGSTSPADGKSSLSERGEWFMLNRCWMKLDFSINHEPSNINHSPVPQSRIVADSRRLADRESPPCRI